MTVKSLPDREALSRRQFLRRGIMAIGALLTTALGAPLISYFVSPALRRSETEWLPIASITDIPLGEPTAVEYAIRKKDGWVRTESRKSAWVVTKNGQGYTVFDPRCTHLGCAYHWEKAKQQFLCPCHTGIFDIDGNVISGPPPRPLDRYEARAENGKLLIGKLIRMEA